MQKLQGYFNLTEARDSNNNLVYDDNGEVVCNLDYDQEFADSLKSVMGWKRVTAKRIREFVKSALEEEVIRSYQGVKQA